jgi:hypothetical protein
MMISYRMHADTLVGTHHDLRTWMAALVHAQTRGADADELVHLFQSAVFFDRELERECPLVPIGDDEALARAIEAILDDPPPAERLRARAELFSVERSVDNYLKLLLPSRPSRQQQQS